MILITGGLGYLGGRIAAHLVLLGFPVRIATSRKNPIIPKVLSSCDIAQIDYKEPKSLQSVCKKVSIILHLAGINAKTSEDDPENALLFNGLTTLKLIEAAQKEGVSKFLYFSTIHIYGNPLTGKVDEEELPRPISHYSITNRIAEDYVILANSYGKLSGAVVRLSNAVGKPIDNLSDCWSLVVNDLCRQAVEKQCLQLNSEGKQQRDFIPITDICNAVEFLIKLPDTNFNGQIINLGGRTYSIYEIALLIAKRSKSILGINVEIKKETKSIKETSSNNLNYKNNKLVNLGFKSKNNLNFEIDQLLQFCNNN